MLTLAVLLAAAAAAPPDDGAKSLYRPETFETLINPNCSHCVDEARRKAGELRDDDRVLAWVRGKYDGGAIPYRWFLVPYRVISDTYGVFVYDADADFVRGYPASLDYRFDGWRNGVMVMRHKDGTLFSCLTGVAFDGPRKGTKLEAVPTLVSDWGFWLRRYPGGVAYHMFDKYQPVELPEKVNEDSRKSRPAKTDDRLPADSLVLGVANGKDTRAYPLEALAKAGILQEEVGGKPWVVLWYGPTRTAAAYLPIASPPKEGPKPRRLTLTRDGKDPAPFVDQETHTRWDIAGRGMEGELKGWTLAWLDGTQVKWFAWAAEYPATTIYTAPKQGAEKPDAKKAIKEIAGSAEYLKGVPKKYATLQRIDAAQRQATLLVDGEKEPATWKLTPDAEIKVRGWWGRLDQLEAATVIQRRHASARHGNLRRIDLGEDHARLGAAFGDDPAPRIDHQRMAEGVAPVLVPTALGGREHEAAVLDGAGAQQCLPVCAPGRAGEGRRHREQLRAGGTQVAVQLREAHVVAHRQPEPPRRGVDERRA